MNHAAGSESEINSEFAAWAQNMAGRGNSRALQNFVCLEKKHHVAAGLEMRLDGGDAALCLRPEGVRGGCVKRWEQVVTQNLAEGMICSQQRGKEALGPLISQFESLNAPGGWVL